MSDSVGVGPYRGGGASSRAVALFQLLRKKITLRAELEIISGKIAETLPGLSPAENAELMTLLASEEAAIDQDVAALQAEAGRIVREEAAHKNVKRLQVPLSRTASKLLSKEIGRRLESGHCPDTSILTEQAIRQTYG